MAAIYAVALGAYPATARQRWIGLAVGLPALFVLNILRLVMLGWLGLHAHSYFEAFHLYWWQGFYVAAVGLGWFAWVWFVVHGDDRRAAKRRSPSSKRAEPATSTRAKRLAVTVTSFAAVFVIGGGLGLWAHGVTLYGRLLAIPQGIGIALVSAGRYQVAEVPASALLAEYGLGYAVLVAVVGLFVVSPGIAWRERARGALCWGLPAVLLVQVAIPVLSAVVSIAFLGSTSDVKPFLESVLTSLFLALHVAIPLVVWRVWTSRMEERATRKRAERRRRAHRARAH